VADVDSSSLTPTSHSLDSEAIGISPDDRVVVVLGAGASISEMRSGGDGRQPPTDADFLRQVKAHAPRRYRQLQKDFDTVWQGSEPYPLRHQRMEQVFSSAFLKVLQTSGGSKKGKAARSLMDDLIVGLRDTLSETTNKARPDQHLSLISKIWNRSPESLDIISLNYDLLADRALLHGQRTGLWTWDFRSGYGFQPDHHSKPSATNDLHLHKLHGSMNWYIPVPGKTRETPYGRQGDVYIPRPARSKTAAAWQRRQQSRGHSKNKNFPLLVPPVFEKGTQINGVLEPVWKNADRALRQATKVLVWGYSLPQTDYHSEVLFAGTARKARYRVLAINPDRAALGRVTGVCGHHWNRWFFDIQHLLDVLP
jgi:hypothetical protein